jgi:hypothetical protein
MYANEALRYMHELRNTTEQTMNKVTNISRTVFGTFGLFSGKEVELVRGMNMWAYTDGSGYAYGAA